MDSSDLAECAAVCDEFVKEGRIRSAREGWYTLWRSCPELSWGICHALGLLYMRHVGDGIAARFFFKQANDHLRCFPETPESDRKAQEVELCRQMTSLSLSYPEYYTWSDRIFELIPDDPVALADREEIDAHKEDGDSWGSVLIDRYQLFKKQITDDCVAMALSLLQLIMENRRQLRIPRDVHRALILECPDRVKNNIKLKLLAMRDSAGGIDFFELNPIMASVRDYLAQYIDENSADTDLIKEIDEWFRAFNVHWKTSTLFDRDDFSADSFTAGEVAPTEHEKRAQFPNEIATMFLAEAEQGQLLAQYSLSMLYLRGTQGLKQNFELAEEWCRSAAVQGQGVAQRMLRIMEKCRDSRSKRTGSKTEAFIPEQSAVDTNDMVENAIRYTKGQGVKRDPQKAIELYRSAAELGNAKAQNILATRYAKGDGVPKDLVESLRLYRLSADQCNPLAQYNLGRCYERGEGVAKDIEKALYWYQMAANQGNEGAIIKLKLLKTNMAIPGWVMIATLLLVVALLIIGMVFK